MRGRVYGWYIDWCKINARAAEGDEVVNQHIVFIVLGI